MTGAADRSFVEEAAAIRCMIPIIPEDGQRGDIVESVESDVVGLDQIGCEHVENTFDEGMAGVAKDRDSEYPWRQLGGYRHRFAWCHLSW